MATKRTTKTTTTEDEAIELPELEAANERGYIGQKVDPTPNENYTVAGVTAGKPTPETDEALAAEAHEAAKNAGSVDMSADADSDNS